MKNRFLYIFFVFTLCIISSSSIAGEHIVFYNTPVQNDSIKGVQINVPNASFDVGADYFPSTMPASGDLSWHPASYKMMKSDGRVVLRLERGFESLNPPSSFSCKVGVRITYYRWNPLETPAPTANDVEVENTDLEVTYNKNKGIKFKEKAFYKLAWAHHIKVEVLTVSEPTYAKFLTLEAEIEQERYKPVTNTALVPVLSISNASTYDADKNEWNIQFNTSAVSGFATEYDVEWTFIESYNSSGGLEPILTFSEEEFRFNSSRITIRNNAFKLNGLFENGYIYYRVRAVGRDITSDGLVRRVECAWSEPRSFTVSDHAPLMNWQYLCTFAEEGKRKDLITYYDGTLRARQVVTQAYKNGDDKYVIVQDKIYDHQGRLAIEPMPSPLVIAGSPDPVLVSAIQYYPDVSMKTGSSSVQYSKADFDMDQSSCNTTTDPMNQSFGASAYFSGNNLLKSATETNYHNYLPVAAGFPFIQTEYTPDNTGRIATRSMPGQDHKIQSEHAVKYQYGKPNQTELDRLFGSEAGYAKHYSKVITRDANGQISVSYMNVRNQVVATALSGKAPDGMQQLSSYIDGGTELAVNLMNSSDVIYKEDAIISTYTFDVAEQMDYKFYYSVNAGHYQPDCLPAGRCANCAYDLEISITNQCDAEQLSFGNVAGKMLKKTIGAGSLKSACLSDEAYNMEEDITAGSDNYVTINLAPGQYTITKKLIVNEEILDKYTQEYLETQNCKTLADFQAAADAAIDLSGCGMTCEECLEKIGLTPESTPAEIETAKTTYVEARLLELTSMGKTTSQADEDAAKNTFDQFRGNCQDMCNTSLDLCTAMREILIGDMSPGGQYAKFKMDEDDQSPTYGKSIADDDNGGDEWNLLGEETGNNISYHNTTLYPEFGVSGIFKIIVNGVEKEVASLSVDEFVNNFQPAWANVMMSKHPEICVYERCVAEQASYDYDEKMLNAMTYDEAKVSIGGDASNTLLSPLYVSSGVVISNDPLFNGTCAADYKEGHPQNKDMWDRMLKYKQDYQYLYYTNSKEDVLVYEEVLVSQTNLKDLKSGVTLGYIASTSAKTGDEVKVYGGASVGIYEKKEVGFNKFVRRIRKVDFSSDPIREYKYTYSMYDLPVITLFCSDYSLTQSKKQYDCVVKNRGKVKNACKDVKDRYWAMFRALYLANKNYISYEISATSPSSSCYCNPGIPQIPSGTAPEKEGLYLREKRLYPKMTADGEELFRTAGGALKDPRTYQPTETLVKTLQTNMQNAIISQCDEQCRSYAEYWMGKLSGCNLTGTDRETILEELINVCKKGCDEKNPMGSSTVAPVYQEGGEKDSEADYKSFHDVLKNALGNRYVEKICDDLLIKVPKPYGHDYLSSESAFADTCSCDQTKYNVFYNQGIACPGTTNPSEENCPCKTNKDVTSKTKSELLIGRDVPQGFKCKQCIGCIPFNAAMQLFTERYPTLEITDPLYPSLLENFLNNELNMNLTFREYHQFAARCINEEEATNATIPDFLEYYEGVAMNVNNDAPLFKAPGIHLWETSPVLIASANESLPEKRDELETQSSLWKYKFSEYIRRQASREEEKKEREIRLMWVENATTPVAVPMQNSFTKNTSAVIDAINGTQQVQTETPQFGPSAKVLDKCGCNKILELVENNENATDEQLATLFADKYNYGEPVSNFSELKKICCASYAGSSLDINPSSTSEDPIKYDHDSEIESGGGDPEGQPTPPEDPEEPEEPEETVCEINFTGEWNSFQESVLLGNAGNNPEFKFPGNLGCGNSEGVSQVDICGCDQLIIYEDEFNGPLGSGYASYSDYVKDKKNIPYDIPNLSEILALCKEVKADGAISGEPWSDKSVSNLFDRTSNPTLVLPVEFKCTTPPTVYPPYNNGGNDGGGWVGPVPCQKNINLSCSDFADMVADIFGGDGSYLNQITVDAYKAQTGNWNALISRFKTDIGWISLEQGCQVNVSFEQDAMTCGQERERYTSFTIPQWAPDTWFTKVIEQIALYGCGCVPGPSWLRSKPRPVSACTTCNAPTKKLVALEGFLNELAVNQTQETYNSVTYDFNKLLTYQTVPISPSSAFAPVYDGSNAGSLTFEWDNSPPYMESFYKMDITDGSGFQKSLILNFMKDHPSNRMYFVRRFFNIRPACPDPEHNFLIDVELDIYDPYAQGNTPPQRVVKTIQGFMKDITLSKPFNCCAKLCNKPAMKEIQLDPCGEEIRNAAKVNAMNNYASYMEDLRTKFRASYIKHCLYEGYTEEFKMKYNSTEHHYTLYYYDQAGNLTQTVPPEGVHFLVTPSEFLAAENARKNYNAESPGTPVKPAHKLVTSYQYNTLNQLIWQKTPDAGVSVFYYDALGRITMSQNAKQVSASASRYSYTRYDALGRIYEVGEVDATGLVDHTTSRDAVTVNALLGGTRRDITKTYYDLPNSIVNASFNQDNLRTRVSWSTIQNSNASSVSHAVYYSYDVHGNVAAIAREITALEDEVMSQGLKITRYDYDLISGKVNTVLYQEGKADQFIHRYYYDMDNRLTSVYSGSRYEELETDAYYQYYLHGPLARTELGDHMVQGVDYVYTLQGWLKGVNSATLKAGNDIGRDGHSSANAVLHANVAKDVYGFILDYYDGDYAPVNSATDVNGKLIFQAFQPLQSGSVVKTASHDLFNGNIKMMTTAIGQFMQEDAAPLASVYTYDQLNRLTDAAYYNNLDMSGNQWLGTGSSINAYRNTFEYDANGNIKKQKRNGSEALPGMDDLTYEYEANSNKLNRVTDLVTDNLAYPDDIDGQVADNYTYDNIGNLITDKSEDITAITWNVYGKISRITYDVLSGKPDIEFQYTPDGHRAVKIVTPKSFQELPVYTYYVRDAQGNIMAAYERKMKRVLDYDQITFTAANNALTTISGATAFQSFIGNLHGADAATKLGVYNVITSTSTGSADFLKATSPAELLASDLDALAYVLNHITPAEFKEGVRFKPNYRQLLCAYMDNTNPAGYRFFEWCMRKLSSDDLAWYIIGMYYNNNAGFESLRTHFSMSYGNYDVLFPAQSANDRVQALIDFDLDDCEDIVPALGYSNIIPNVPSVLLEDVQSTGGIFDNTAELVYYLYNNNTTANQEQIWQYVFDYYGSANAALAALRNNRGQVFMSEFARQQRSSLDSYQQSHNTLYSASGNMEAYFAKISELAGQSAYDQITMQFYNLWRTYTDKISIAERHIYGSSRLGVNSKSSMLYEAKYEDVNNNNVLDPSEKTTANHLDDLDEVNLLVERGYKRYELSNHLGNVLAVVSDKHIPVFSGSTLSYYGAELLQASDYSPFGAPLAARTYDAIALLSKEVKEENKFETSDVEGWTVIAANSDVAVDNGRLKFSTTHTAPSQARKSFTTTPGKRYRISADIDITVGYSNNMYFQVLGYGGTDIAFTRLMRAKDHYELEFISNNSSINLQLSYGYSGTREGYIDNVKFEEIIGDEGSYRFGFKGQEMDDKVSGNGNSYTAEFWQYDSRLGRRWNVDPEFRLFAWQSVYATFDNCPILMVDPLGRSANPIYDTEGNFLGTDDKGLKGSAIIMDKKNFKQNMAHEVAETFNMCQEALKTIEVKKKFADHYAGLSSRPDFDGVMTYNELLQWGRDKGDQPVFLDASKINLGSTVVDDFPGVGKGALINTTTKGAPLDTYGPWGKNYMILLSENGKVKLSNDRFDYEQHNYIRAWQEGMSTGLYETFIRYPSIYILQAVHGVDDSFGFDLKPYGYGQVSKEHSVIK